jgi:hypothetical protein
MHTKKGAGDNGVEEKDVRIHGNVTDEAIQASRLPTLDADGNGRCNQELSAIHLWLNLVSLHIANRRVKNSNRLVGQGTQERLGKE